MTLLKLRRLEESLAIFLELTQREPDYGLPWYNLARGYALQQKEKEAVEALQKAIELDQKYKELAKIASDFDSIRDSAVFKKLVNEK